MRKVNTKSGAVPDVVLAVNGLPVATLELKNPMSATRWNVENAKYQYRFERDPKELLFAFKQRCLVHFAVDTELVFMTTKLEGKDTFFLPFNLGHDFGAGNPHVMNEEGGDVRTADQLFFDQVRETAVANEQLRQAVMANSIENFEPVFNKQLENLFIERMDGNEEIFV